MKGRWTILVAVAALVAAGVVAGTEVFDSEDETASATPELTGAIDPSNFVAHVTNPYFPLKPGTVLVYKGLKDGDTQIDRVTVTNRTKVVQGVRTTVVRDVATAQGGRALESTVDWFAQDEQGNVWYFGEATKSYEGGKVSTEGSWQAGEDGAKPGIVMEAHPQVSSGYRQELYPGHAEDMAWITSLGDSLRVPYGNLENVLLTMEWTRLEPGVIDRKWYAPGIGIVREASATGAVETAQLVDVIRP